MPVAEFGENSLRVISAVDHQGLHKTFWSQKLTFLGKLVDQTQFEALSQTQAAEVGCTALEKTSLISSYSLLLN